MTAIPEIRLAFDPGASLTKCVYSINGGQPQLLTMEPEVATVPVSSIKTLHLAPTRPQDQAWIQLEKDADAKVCGFLAKQFTRLERLDLLKYEYALYKILAAVGAIATTAGVDRFSLKATSVLPYSEMANALQLESALKQSLKRFYFQGKLLRGQVSDFSCVVEGTGLAWHLIKRNGLDWFNQSTVIALIFGYRNLSCLTFDRGIPQKQHSSTNDLGFVKLLDQIMLRTSGQDRQKLAEIVPALNISQITPQHPKLHRLVKSTLPENIQTERQNLTEAIKTSHAEYWSEVDNWLDIVVPDETHEVVISGGTALYLKPELEQRLKWADPIWVKSELGKLAEEDAETQFRFADVAILFESTLQSQEQAV